MSNAANTTRVPGFPQGLFLLLPITLAVIGVSVFTATVNQMQEHFKDVPNGAYLVNLLQTMPGFWIVAFSPVAGWLADRFGRRNILVASMLVYAIAGVAPFRMEDIYAILFTRCLVGMCESVVLTVTTTMLCDYFKGRSRDKWLASQTGVASLSALVIIPLGGVLGAKFGWQGPFLVYLYSLVLVVFVIAYCWEPAHEAPSASEVAEVNADAKYQTIPWGRMAGILAITIVGSVCFYSTITQNANALVQLGVTDLVEPPTTRAEVALPTPYAPHDRSFLDDGIGPLQRRHLAVAEQLAPHDSTLREVLELQLRELRVLLRGICLTARATPQARRGALPGRESPAACGSRPRSPGSPGRPSACPPRRRPRRDRGRRRRRGDAAAAGRGSPPGGPAGRCRRAARRRCAAASP